MRTVPKTKQTTTTTIMTIASFKNDDRQRRRNMTKHSVKRSAPTSLILATHTPTHTLGTALTNVTVTTVATPNLQNVPQKPLKFKPRLCPQKISRVKLTIQCEGTNVSFSFFSVHGLAFFPFGQFLLVNLVLLCCRIHSLLSFSYLGTFEHPSYSNLQFSNPLTFYKQSSYVLYAKSINLPSYTFLFHYSIYLCISIHIALGRYQSDQMLN